MMHSNPFLEKFSQYPNEQLEEITAFADDYMPEAVLAARFELLRRKGNVKSRSGAGMKIVSGRLKQYFQDFRFIPDRSSAIEYIRLWFYLNLAISVFFIFWLITVF